MKDFQAIGETSSPQKNIQHYKQYISSLFIFLGPFLSDPDPADLDQCGSMQIRIHNTAIYWRNPLSNT
jgi:hypothetical protein